MKSITIPEEVVSINDYAFYGCEKLASIIIPSSVTTIGTAAFNDCTGLEDMYCYAINLPTTDTSLFNSSSIENATLHVPVESVSSYYSTSPWNGFKEIVSLTDEETGIETVCNSGSERMRDTTVLDMQGRCIAKPAKGIYIINGCKVLIK